MLHIFILGMIYHRVGNNMLLENYASFFHDGSINSIDHIGNKVVISMESAEIEKKNNVNKDIAVSKSNRICGKLHLEGIKDIFENGIHLEGVFKKKYVDAEIAHFKVSPHEVELHILWYKSPPETGMQDFSEISVVAKRVWWENIPDQDC